MVPRVCPVRSHFQHTVEIVDLPYMTFFSRLGHARILAGATERTL